MQAIRRIVGIALMLVQTLATPASARMCGMATGPHDGRAVAMAPSAMSGHASHQTSVPGTPMGNHECPGSTGSCPMAPTRGSTCSAEACVAALPQLPTNRWRPVITHPQLVATPFADAGVARAPEPPPPRI